MAKGNYNLTGIILESPRSLRPIQENILDPRLSSAATDLGRAGVPSE